MGFLDILEKYRAAAFSERDKGDRFERLMQAYLKTDPKYTAALKEVWMWSDFPFRKDFGGKDLGIDLVAKTYNNEYWAIQCKCYAENTAINKADVDTFLSTSNKRFCNDNLQSISFTHRLWISTTNKWSKEAEITLQNQQIPVNRINLADLVNSDLDWEKLDKGIYGASAQAAKYEVRAHQKVALERVHEHFLDNNRARLIMACGTGKTFTALKIAENETNSQGLILFLVPSIALLGQSLDSWASQAEKPIKAICICSDAEASKKKTKNDEGGYSIEDLALPASTNVKKIMEQFDSFKANPHDGMIVVFSTYQSIERISEVQKELNSREPNSCIFDLIICDEAHRTTGVSLRNDKGDYDESSFVRVHDNEFIQSKKRMYMTATPRLYNDDSKSEAKKANAYLCSMDDVAIYGEEVYRIGFGEAVQRGLLSDYKVLVLTIKESEIPKVFRDIIEDENNEVKADDITKLIGCINALSKRTLLESDLIKSTDPAPMKRAVAFCQNIKISKHITDVFNAQKETYYDSLGSEEREQLVTVSSDHIDGTMGAVERETKLNWLKSCNEDSNECRILTNVRCLSEGVDVPSLDAVMFLSSRNSQVDVVQSVGRVMRKAEGKKYGYIIIPVIIPSDIDPEASLDKHDGYKVVWTVLNALRAHDDRFNATINKIDLNKKKPDNIVITTIGKGNGSGEGNYNDDGVTPAPAEPQSIQQEFLLKFENFQEKLYAKMVKKVGERRYWEIWAKDIANVAMHHVERIKNLVSNEDEYKNSFSAFLAELHQNLNPSISKNEAIEMLAQHIITKPVFEALFENYSFVKNNPVSIAMQQMVELLQDEIPTKDAEVMAEFYKSIQQRCDGIDNAEGKQKIIVELYDKFFKDAFPKVVEQLGIVYTPVEAVDFIIHSVADVLKQEFNRDISDDNVHILDPFTGTGTFITRLLQSGLIRPADLERKYLNELHANELVLLAYYIASINIENVYHDISKDEDYKAFNGICLTDTFQLGEKQDYTLIPEIFAQNSDRVNAQRKAPIRVIMGNPPYSIGQKSANDNAQNQSYPSLDNRIAYTYVSASAASLNKSVYDSYIKAFRWASDRLANDGGVIAFISNAGWLDGKGLDGFRKCLEEEFSSIYVFNLRGNQRTSGELSRQEGGKIFGSGSRTPISITLLVKNPKATNNKATIKYATMEDYKTREEKLKIIKHAKSLLSNNLNLAQLTPDEHGDWLNQRNDLFSTFIPIEPEKKFDLLSKSFFNTNVCGVSSGRDSWIFNFANEQLCDNTSSMIDFYNQERERFQDAKSKNKELDIKDFVNTNPIQISWTRGLRTYANNNELISFKENYCLNSIYRPFMQQRFYSQKFLIESPGLSSQLFPTNEHKNLIICVSGIGGTKEHSTLIVDKIACYDLVDKTQCFPMYYYEKMDTEQLNLFDNPQDEYIRHDGVTDFILERCRENYGPKVTKEDIFYYVYGLLHHPDYKHKFSADLKKMLPRIPLVSEPKDFRAFSKAGRELAQLHLNYETQPCHEKVTVKNSDCGNYLVDKMKFAKTKAEDSNKTIDDTRTIFYNSQITICDIPQEAYSYIVNGKSAIHWILERYQVTTNKDSQITNNPNDWAIEHNQPKYILDLLLSIITVSTKTMAIINKLPKLNLESIGEA